MARVGGGIFFKAGTATKNVGGQLNGFVGGFINPLLIPSITEVKLERKYR